VTVRVPDNGYDATLHAFDKRARKLGTEQFAAIDALDIGVRGGPEPHSITLDN
jgi:hypothetical protein